MARLKNNAIIGAYRIVGELGADGTVQGGRGQFGITYRARTTSGRGQPVAIKEYFPNTLARRGRGNTITTTDKESHREFLDGLAEFEREAEALDRFNHPNIVRVIDFIQKNGTAYIVMEWIEGETLAKQIGSRRSGDQHLMTVDALRPILLQLLDALDTLHSATPLMLHRDIKPGNIMIRSRDGSPVLIDFGAARQVTAAATQQLTTILTKGYAPYEQYVLADEDEMDGEPVQLTAAQRAALPQQGPRTDLYALGAVCHFALTGETPGDGLMRKFGNIPYRALETRVANRPSDPAALAQWRHFLQLIDTALEVEPTNRIASARKWIEAIKSGKSAPPPPPPSPPPPPPPAFNPAWIWGSAVLIVLLLVLIFNLPDAATNNIEVNQTDTLANVENASDQMNMIDTAVENVATNETVSNESNAAVDTNTTIEPPIVDPGATETPVPTPTVTPASNDPYTPAAPGDLLHNVMFNNQCKYNIEMVLEWHDPNGGWKTWGIYPIAGNTKIRLSDSDSNQRYLKVSDTQIYYYAYIPNADYSWAGKGAHIRTFRGKDYDMRGYAMGMLANGDYELPIDCTNRP